MTPQSRPVRVLVVDDDQMSRDLLSALLQAEDYSVVCADSGDAALALLRQSGHAPDLVLTDAQMPGASGAQLAAELRRACPPNTLLMAMSASRPPEQDIARFDGFLLKPFNVMQIASFLAEHTPTSAEIKHMPTRERWIVVRGPAARPPSSSRLISIQASSPQTVASNRRMKGKSPKPSSAQTLRSASASEIPVLDEEIYGRLAASMPAPQLHEMYAMCARDVRKRISAMRRMAATRDAEACAHEAHAIKGGCGMLGATELHRIAARLEANGLHHTAEQGASEVNSLDELAAACDRLERILGSRA